MNKKTCPLYKCIYFQDSTFIFIYPREGGMVHVVFRGVKQIMSKSFVNDLKISVQGVMHVDHVTNLNDISTTQNSESRVVEDPEEGPGEGLSSS